MRRDTLILIGLFAALVAMIALGPGRSTSTPDPRPSSHSSSPEGALALYRWLEAMGYESARLQYSTFAPDPDATLLIVLGPSERYTREEAAAVADWVAEGGVLLVAEERAGRFGMAANLLDAFELEVVKQAEQLAAQDAPVLQPALGAPPAALITAQTTTAIRSERNDLAYLVGSSEQPLLVGLQHGAGYVFASSALYPFSNAGIDQADNPALMLNLLRRVPAGGRVVFDEFHHGFISEPSLRNLLLETPWGWAILYSAVIGAGYLALTGRRFGKAIPLKAEAGRRSSAEYLESLAGLLRRAGKADYLQDHYRTTFKRKLARFHGLNPEVDDQVYLEALHDVSPAQARAARAVLAQLGSRDVDEAALLRAVAEADRVVEG